MPRPRVTRWGTYIPGKLIKTWLEELNNQISGMQPAVNLADNPVEVFLTFGLPHPKSHHVSNNPDKPLKPKYELKWHLQKPDVDNLAKAVLDVLVKQDILYDDAQICSLHIKKKWTHSKTGYVTIVIREIEEADSTNEIKNTTDTETDTR